MGELVSTIVNTYNRADLLPETVHSVMGQTYPEIECVVIDDGSTDGTPEKVRDLARQHPPGRIRYIYQENRGFRQARDRGVEESHGAYLQFLDSDDLISPDKFSLQVSFLEAHPDAAGVYGDVVYFVDREGRRERLWSFARHGPDPLALALERPLANWTSSLFRTRDVLDAGPLGPGREFMDDWEFSLRVLLSGRRLLYLPGDVGWYRFHPESQMSGDRMSTFLDGGRHLDRCLDVLREKGILGRYRRHLAKGYINMARGFLCIGKQKSAWGQFSKAFCVYPPFLLPFGGYMLLSATLSPRRLEGVLRAIRRAMGRPNAVPEGPVTGM